MDENQALRSYYLRPPKCRDAWKKGKKLHDKRQDLKAKDTKRDMERAMKY